MACGCLALLLVAAGGGTLAFVLGTRPDRDASPSTSTSAGSSSSTSTSSSESKPPETAPAFKVITPLDEVSLNEDGLRQVMETNPLTEGTLPAGDACELPTPTKKLSGDQLEEFLNTGSGCLASVWGEASSQRSLPWDTLDVVVYDWPHVPTSECRKDSFEKDYPRVCNLDGKIYWPSDYGASFDAKHPGDLAPLLLWDLAFVQQNTLMWQSSVGLYYQHLEDAIGDDAEKKDDASRRYLLQNACMASAAVMQLPEGSRPSTDLQQRRAERQNRDPDQKPSIQESTVDAWTATGAESDGDLSACNTWKAESSQVE
ncbi:hypothetical protein DEO23_04670 [Brachybacterium endophyticum]|uniref:Uncharacterized protein n=1 Tax=Brachybacterium endophyticum TaxID=2182385 RepID=A0A2U2RKH3_9MICO|nr:hypothetical protein DEO23_04670 [Brachybacterium endophyticum]